MKLDYAPPFRPATRFAVFRLVSQHFLWLVFMFTTASAWSQDPGGGEANCNTGVDCSKLSVQIVLNPTNVSTDCSINTACGGGDNFRQLFYTVRLRFKTTNPLDDLDFNLDYNSLRVKVRLAVSGFSPVLFSHIDETVTESCYKNGPGMNWGNTGGNNYNVATFEPEPYAVTIDFLDDIINEACGGDLIHFTPGDCVPNTPGEFCAYADLFVVAVNAYPGEQIQVVCQETTFGPGAGIAACDLPCNYEPNGGVTVASPSAPSTGPNINLQVRLKDPVSAANGKGGCDIEVEVANSGNDAAAVYYMEFVAKVSTGQAMQPLEITSGHNTTLLTAGSDTYIRFVAQGFITVAANSAVSLGTITINPPVLQNQSWSVVTQLVDEGKSRLQAGLYPSGNVLCSALPLNTTSKNCGNTGDPSCGSGFPVKFKIWPPENVSSACPSTKKVKVGLIPASPSVTSIDLRHFEFKVNFDLSHGAAITGANTNPTIDSNRDLCLSTEPAGCVDCLGSSQTDCWEQEGDATFKYCFDRTNTNAHTLDVTGDGAYLEIFFNESGCINAVTISALALKLDGSQAMCIPPIDPISTPFSICEPQVYGRLATELDNGLENARITLKQTENTGSCNTSICPDIVKQTPGSPEPGKYSFCPCSTCTKFSVVPEKNDDPLNGVTTFDLVLINKHILGLEPLNSPYKIIAADANKSKSLTTFDIVELRKLILGIYTQLPNNTSWRFVDKAYQFPNSSNPFQEIFPETRNVDMAVSNIHEANFVAVKVGDVNLNAIASTLTPHPATTVQIPSMHGAKAGQSITIPVTYSGTEPLEAFQLGLRFDPKVISLVGPSQGDLPNYNAGNFGLGKAEQGEIRTLWFADPSTPGEAVEPGTVLFYLSFIVKGTVPKSGIPLRVDDSVLPNAAWKTNGFEFTLVNEEAVWERREVSRVKNSALQVTCYPNPASGSVSFTIHTTEAGRGRLALFGPFGERVYMQDIVLEAGAQTVEAPEFAALPSGVYIWKVLTPRAKTQGHLVKL